MVLTVSNAAATLLQVVADLLKTLEFEETFISGCKERNAARIDDIGGGEKTWNPQYERWTRVRD